MSGKNELIKLIQKHDGIITAKLVDENHIHREYLKALVQDGVLQKVAGGVYISPDVWEDQMMILQLKKKHMVYSHETALYLHDLSDRDPLNYIVTVPHGYNPSRLKAQGLKVHTVKKELFDLGICYKKTTFGNMVKTYDKVRTICDIFRDKNNQDPSLFSDAIKRYLTEKDKDLNKLIKYAELFRVKNILKPYLEIIL